MSPAFRILLISYYDIASLYQPVTNVPDTLNPIWHSFIYSLYTCNISFS